MTTDQLPDEHPSPQDANSAQLAAEIAIEQPSLPHTLRSTCARVCEYADLLEAELRHFRPLEGYMAGAVKVIEARTGRAVSDALYNRLCDRFGITEARLALERVTNAHPDAPQD